MMKKKGVKKKLIIALAVIIAAGAGTFAAMNQSLDVSVFYAERGAVERLIIETGNVEAAGSVVLSSKIQGQLSSVYVKEGETVSEGQRVASFTADNQASAAAADISSLQAQIAGLRAQADQANEIAAKNRQLYEQGAMSYEEYNAAETNARQLEAQIASLQHNIAGRSASVESREVFAPISGTVTSVFVNGGEIVSPGAPMIEISDISDVFITVNLISEDADEVSEGDRARIFSENSVLIDESSEVGKIFIKAQDVMSDLGIVQKRVPVEITLSGGKSLRLGSSVNVEIIVDERQNALRIPDNAIFEINRSPHVYVITDGKATLREVETGLLGESYTEIISGLSEGDMVITSPAREVEDGKKVKAPLD